MSPGEVVKYRASLASNAVEQLISWINDELPKKYIGKETYVNESNAPERYGFQKIKMTAKIRDTVEKAFQSAGWKVRHDRYQWWFTAPQNIDTPDLM